MVKKNKAIVSQDNRFIYAKYNMNTNEIKLFLWIIAQLNSQKEDLFKVCEVPIDEVFKIWNWKSQDNYKYIKEICSSMLSKTYIEDFKVLDEKTKIAKNAFEGYSIFKRIRYVDGAGYITYQLNDSLIEYFLNLKSNFTQLKFSDIQDMKSSYSIRIYNMLICEIKQNRDSLKINLEVLQNTLEVPKSLKLFYAFNNKVLKQTQYDINTKSNLVLYEIEHVKTGRQVTDLIFKFEYKDNKKNTDKDKNKKKHFNQALIKTLKSMFLNKRINIDLNEYVCIAFEEVDEKIYIHLYNHENNKTQIYLIKDYSSIKTLKKCLQKSNESFYGDSEKLKSVIEFKNKTLNSNNT